MKKSMGLALLAALLLCIFSGCSDSGFVNTLLGRSGPVVEMPKPTDDETGGEKPEMTPLSIDSENVQNVLSGLLRPDAFTWQGEATYTAGEEKTSFRSSVFLSGGRARVRTYNGATLVHDSLLTGEELITMNAAGGVISRTTARQGFSYDALAGIADVGAVLPTEPENIKEAALTTYNDQAAVYLLVQNGKVTEEYYLGAVSGVPLFVKCTIDGAEVYAFSTLSFEQAEPPQELLTR